MSDGIGLAEKMLGLPGLVVLEVDDVPGEVIVRVESTRRQAVCPSCRRRARHKTASRCTCVICTASGDRAGW